MMELLLGVVGCYGAAAAAVHMAALAMSRSPRHNKHYILVTRDEESRLENCIRSLQQFARQTGTPVRITVCDQGSTDDTTFIAMRSGDVMLVHCPDGAGVESSRDADYGAAGGDSGRNMESGEVNEGSGRDTESGEVTEDSGRNMESGEVNGDSGRNTESGEVSEDSGQNAESGEVNGDTGRNAESGVVSESARRNTESREAIAERERLAGIASGEVLETAATIEKIADEKQEREAERAGQTGQAERVDKRGKANQANQVKRADQMDSMVGKRQAAEDLKKELSVENSGVLDEKTVDYRGRSISGNPFSGNTVGKRDRLLWSLREQGIIREQDQPILVDLTIPEDWFKLPF